MMLRGMGGLYHKALRSLGMDPWGREEREETPHASIFPDPIYTLPYQKIGASLAHRTLAGLPGRTEGMVHRHVPLVGILPASSAHNPGFQDRW